jgi:putative hemolysin
MDELFANDSAAIIGFITCGVISALFSGSETAITGLGSLKAKHILDTRGEKAKELNLWLHHPSRVLTTILLFNTAVNILASAIATEYANRYFNNKALAVATGFTTLVVLIFCEIIPKTLGKIYTESLKSPCLLSSD